MKLQILFCFQYISSINISFVLSEQFNKELSALRHLDFDQNTNFAAKLWPLHRLKINSIYRGCPAGAVQAQSKNYNHYTVDTTNPFPVYVLCLLTP